MMSNRSHRRKSRIALVLLVALAVAVIVAGSAWGANPSRGYALVEAVDPVGHTVTLHGTVYTVRPQTDFQMADGSRGRLRDLRAASGGSGLQAVADVDWVYYEAAQTPAGWVLTRLHVQEGAPK